MINPYFFKLQKLENQAGCLTIGEHEISSQVNGVSGPGGTRTRGLHIANVAIYRADLPALVVAIRRDYKNIASLKNLYIFFFISLLAAPVV